MGKLAGTTVTIERDDAGEPQRLLIDVESHTTNRETQRTDALETLVEEMINAYSLACADWQTNSMRELLIEEQIASWRARFAAATSGTG